MNNLPWIEKYRAENLEDVILPDLINKQLNKIIESGNVPNLIITGSSGIGKTTAMVCLAKKILGENMKNAFKELNASDERGIRHVEENVVHFCQKKIIGIQKKILLFDESDNMTIKQQQLISVILNDYEKNTAFFFTCNSSDKIIEQIQSKCIIIRFTRLEANIMQKILIDICKKEKIEFNNEGVNALVSVSNGDMRTAINNLHAVYCNKKYINKKNIFLVCDVLDHSLVCSLIKDCLKQKNNDKLIASIEEMFVNGYAVSDILQGLLDCIKYDNILKEEGVELSEKQKIIFMNEISRTKIIFSFGVDTIEQLYACFFRIINKLL